MRAASIRGRVVVRFPPSPTGTLHLGGARTALFNYLFSEQNDGKRILRIEDTDRERSKAEFETDIRDSLDWLGLTFHESYRQSERTALYVAYLKQLIDSGAAYHSAEEKGEGKRQSVIRFRNTGGVISFNDIIRGQIKFDTTELGDFVIAKSEEEPLYHLAVVVDDHEMGITHVIRGEDHISNTPRQILIQRAIQAAEPAYAHIPLILAPDRSKLSKRHGAVAVSAYRERGYTPEALINYLALLGWHPEDDREMFSLQELVPAFRLERVQKGGAVFNEDKLRSLNREYLRKENTLVSMIAVRIRGVLKLAAHADEDLVQKVAFDLKERIFVLSDIDEISKSGELDYFFSAPQINSETLLWRRGGTVSNTEESLLQASKALETIDVSEWSLDTIRSLVMPIAEKQGKGIALWPLRYALSGRMRSPDPFVIASILGRDETLRRLSRAIESLTETRHRIT